MHPWCDISNSKCATRLALETKLNRMVCGTGIGLGARMETFAIKYAY